MPITLSTLFCTPQDCWDLLSSEGVDLRLDDHNLATGQIITLSADALQGATSLSTVATPVALLKGAVIVFDGAGMSAPVSVALAAAANAGATSLTVAATSAALNSGAQARDSGVNAATAARMLVGCRKGTSKVKLYCNGRYDDSQLVLSGSVCDWSTLYACKWLCERRAQGCPKSLLRDWEEAFDELKMVQLGQLMIEDIGTRGTDWPSISNVIVDPTRDGMRVRVQPSVSEATPTVYGQYIDWNSLAVLSF